MAIPVTKRCRCCQQDRPGSEYHRRASNRDGLYSYCRSCALAKAKAHQSKPEVKARKRAYDAVYNEKHKERKRQQVLARYYSKSDEIKAKVREWQDNNRDRVRAYKQATKAARRSTVEVGMSGAELHEWRSAQPKVCHWCGVKCARKFHVDHYRALSKGGKHEASNLRIACPTCNLRKHAKDPLDFAREVGRLF